MDKEEVYEPPPTDPAKALRYAIELIRQQQREAHEREALIRDVNATLILTKRELSELKREYEADQSSRRTREGALKRSELQFLTGIGWLDKR